MFTSTRERVGAGQQISMSKWLWYCFFLNWTSNFSSSQLPSDSPVHSRKQNNARKYREHFRNKSFINYDAIWDRSATQCNTSRFRKMVSSKVEPSIFMYYSISFLIPGVCIAISFSPSVRMSGFISKPDFGSGRSSADRQYYYINHRPCDLPKVTCFQQRQNDKDGTSTNMGLVLSVR